MEGKEKKFLTVAPFQCAWRKDFKFREAGRGCVAFDAFALNDVTVVFRENVGSEHYHYKRDNSPHYTVIIGSHRNRRLKIEVDGETVVDAEGIGLCCTSTYQSYWISVYDGLISVGKGRYPFQNIVFEWLDSNPNCTVQYVGLSSWDKHVGYRNVNVLPLQHNHMLMWKQVESREFDMEDDGQEELDDEMAGYDQWGLDYFLENWELSDVLFIVGEEERPVPAHKVILQASGTFPLSSSKEDVIQLQDIPYATLHALLQYIYMGQTQISESQLSSLWALSLKFEVTPLAKQCEKTVERFKLNKKLFDSGKKVELSCPLSHTHGARTFPSGYPISVQRLKQLHVTGEYSDVQVNLEGHGLVAQAHKVIFGLWSLPFAKMFTNGMSETSSSMIYLADVSTEAFIVMLDFMYTGELHLDNAVDFGTLLLELLIFSDQYGVTMLYQECCKILLECLSEDSVCPILRVVSQVPPCKLVAESCLRKFAMHFDFCTTANLDFIMLDDATFGSILQHQDLTVTSEEKVLNAILMWCMRAEQPCGWETVDEMMACSTPEYLFKERLQSVDSLFPCVRFPLFPPHLLEKLEQSNLCKFIGVCDDLVKEAIKYVNFGLPMLGSDKNPRFHHRRSSFKELQYICDGDNNGVLYFAGTSYGQHQWVNPVLAKRINIAASSPASRYTDPKVLVSRTYQGTSFAGPRLEDGNKCTWWTVDLGQDHQLMCNYYTFRQDGSRTYVRSWNFQGSMDGRAWTNLRIHENDQTICKPAQYASWVISGPNALLPFRFFRVLLTGPTADSSNPWNLAICFMELYGYFHQSNHWCRIAATGTR